MSKPAWLVALVAVVALSGCGGRLRRGTADFRREPEVRIVIEIHTVPPAEPSRRGRHHCGDR